MAAQEPRRTKILATIGPATSDKATVERLVEAGMNAVRLNFSHGSHDDHAEVFRTVREVQDESGWRTLAIVGDLQGPKLRVGDLDAPLVVENGEELVVAGEDSAVGDDLPVAPSVLSLIHI